MIISVTIPAFNEGNRLPAFLGDLVLESLELTGTVVELIVVDDGSNPEHVARHRSSVAAAAEHLAHAGSQHTVRLIECEKNQGKASAVRRGWDEADPNAAWLGFLDADGATSAREFFRLVRMLGDDFDMLAGSRILMAGRRVHRSTYRHVQGRVFATLAEQVFHLKVYDTQCGVKLFRASMLRPLLGLVGERGWLLDLELMALVSRCGGRLREEPIDWWDPGGSKMKFGVDAMKMLIGLLRIRQRIAAHEAAGRLVSAPSAPSAVGG
jgi:glycosyltransferase involved in cell wall biosynthesis